MKSVGLPDTIMTVASRNISQAPGAGASLHQLVLMICLVILIIIGTGFLSIVLWQNSIANKIQVFILIPLLGITLLYHRHLLRGAIASPEIVLLVIFAAITVNWSIFPAETVERAVPLVVMSLFGIALGSMLSLRGLMLFIAVFFGLCMVLALAAVITLPQARGIPPWGDTWNGIYKHKNGLGAAAAAAMLTCTYATKQVAGKLKTFFICLTVLALFLLVASESRTSQVVAVIMMLAYFASRVAPKRETIWAISFILFTVLLVGITAFILASPLAEPLFALIGRKPTLSGRIPLWELAWPFVMERFWLGWGYSAYWFDDAPHLIAYSGKGKLAYEPFYSHNGLIETFLNVGFVGVSLFILAVIRFFHSIFFSIRFIQHRDEIVLAFALCIMFLLANITESFILDRQSATWVFFIAYSTKLNLIAKTLRAGKRANYFAPR